MIVCVFAKSIQFCKYLLGVKICSKNEVVSSGLSRKPLLTV